MNEFPIACALGQFTEEQRSEYKLIVTKLIEARVSFAEAPNKLVFTYDGSLETLNHLSEWINFERICCPFLTFMLSIGNVETNIQLTIVGSEEAIRFIKHELASKNML